MKIYSAAFIILSLFSFKAHAWSIANSARSGFPSSNITIKISSNSCANAGMTAATMQTLVQDAINDYWSKVSTSSLELSSSGVDSSINTNTDTLNDAVNKTSANTIIVGCSQNATLFSSGSILGVGGMGCVSGICKGAVLLNDTASTRLATLDRTTILATFAHELGHALGLGHTSVEEALMYYSVSGKTQKALAQDDIDGISYLYPAEKKLGGLAGACGSIDTSGRGPTNFLGSLFLGLLIILASRLVPHFKSRVTQA